MNQLLIALVVSVAFHGLLAIGLSAGFAATDVAVEEKAPQLELVQVDFSFADVEDATARPAHVEDALQPPPSPSRAVPEPQVEIPEPEGLLPPSAESPSAVPPPAPKEEEPPPEVARPVPAMDEALPPEVKVPAESAPQTAEVLAAPSPRQDFMPVYPMSAKRRGEEGRVLVEATVGVDGRVRTLVVRQSSGFPALDGAACKAVRKARFTPAHVGDKPVEGRVTVPIDFRLKDAQ